MQNLKDNEERIRAYWKENKTDKKVRESRKDGKRFYFLDGPPYAHDSLMTHHMWVGSFKDAIIRYKRYTGFNIHDRAGFDVHGLPTENKVERKLNFKSKADIESFGIDKFIEQCRIHSDENIKKGITNYERFGVSLDFENVYLPYKNEYIEKGWWILKEMHKKNLLYKGVRALAYCPHCETTFSSQGPEIEYSDDTDSSIMVAFPVETSKVNLAEDTYLVIWTTTPWTIPSNMAIAVNPEALYVAAKCADRTYIVAKDRLSQFSNEIGESTVVTAEFYGSELKGTSYRHVLEDKIPMQKKFAKYHRVITDKSVSLTEGTGLLHIAPGHGAEDFIIGLANKLPIFSPLDEHARYNADAGEYEGLLVPNEANKIILEELQKNHSLLHVGSITHSYPHCWRCDSKLIFRATDQWFINVQKIKKKLVKINSKVKWHPEEAKLWQAETLESSPDWCISRQRYWGIPIPIWECKNCKNIEVIGSFGELKEKSKIERLPENMHKPYVDQIAIKCDKCGSEMRRIPDIFDVWYDSGIAHTASLTNEEFERLFPPDLITESRDQIRGWFTTLMRTAVGAEDKTAFKEVIIGGMLLDEIGKHMHRHLGNSISIEQLLEIVSADGFRLFCLSKPRWSNLNLNKKDLREADNSIITIHNMAELVKEFAALSGIDTREQKLPTLSKLLPEERWIVSRINSLMAYSTKNMDTYNIDSAIKELRAFAIEDLSRFYFKMAKKRAELADKKELKRIASVTAYVLKNFIIMFSVATPFTSESIYQDMFSKDKESIFLESWPKAKSKLVDAGLEEDFSVMKDVVTAILAAREKNGIRLRQPLSSATIETNEDSVVASLEKLSDIIEDYTNVKKIIIKKTSLLQKEIKPVYAKLGPSFKGNASAVAEALSKTNAYTLEKEIATKGSFTLQTDGNGRFEILPEHFTTIDRFEENADKLQFAKGLVSLDTNITEELKDEMFIRELTRKIQIMRKEQGLTKKDFIEVYIETNESFKNLFEKNSNKLAAIVKAKRILFNKSPKRSTYKEEDLGNTQIKIAVEKIQ